MNKRKLKKLNIDFLYFEKKRKKIVFFKQFMLIFLAVIVILSIFFHIIKTKQLNNLQQELRIKNRKIEKIKTDIEKGKKQLNFYKKNMKKLVSLLNIYIDKKGYPIEDDIKFIKRNLGNITLFNFNYREDSSIKIELGSKDFSDLISFKSYLEKKFSVKITSDEKKNGLYYQILLLKREGNE